jgi:hypothetical protein
LQLQELLQQFGISPSELLPGSYGEMIKAQCSMTGECIEH